MLVMFRVLLPLNIRAMHQITLTFGLVCLACQFMSFASGSFCTESYSCGKTCYRSERYSRSCGLFGWGRCNHRRTVHYGCTGTCYRKICCSGYNGSSCTTPLCYGSTSCPNNGTCISPNNCTCTTGFTGPHCEDIDECAEGTDGCSQLCKNTHGSFSCLCRSGYYLSSDRKTCDIDINGCIQKNGDCQQKCVHVPGSTYCSCDSGYSLDGNARNCSDIDECSSGRSTCEHSCTNTFGSYSCGCRTGFIINGHNCTDIDECIDGTTRCDQLCNNIPGTFTCSCSSGFTLAADGRTCTEIDMCNSTDANCEHVCNSKHGSFICTCHVGYKLNSDGHTCTDINECDTSGCDQTCTNTNGSYTCSCLHGYILHSDGHTCIDIDDCVGVDCQNGGTCVDGVGFYTCTCGQGTTGNHCQEDIDECALLNGGCQDICLNSVGSFKCSCPNGKLGNDGLSCNGTGLSQMHDVFSRHQIKRKQLPRGCSTIVLSTCPTCNKTKAHLSSTSPWYQSTSNTSIMYTPGVVFVEVNSFALPVSLNGVNIYINGNNFQLNIGVGSLTMDKGTPVGTLRTTECYSMDLTWDDTYDFISSNSFLKSYFYSLSAEVPDWLELSGEKSNTLALTNMKADLVYGKHVEEIDFCKGAPVFENHIYSVFRFDSDFELKVYGNTYHIPGSVRNKAFCLIIDICNNCGGSVFLMFPEESRNILSNLHFFQETYTNQGLTLKPNGIGLSSDKGIRIGRSDTGVKLWNGDRLFNFPIFERADVWFSGTVIKSSTTFSINTDIQAFVTVPTLNQLITGTFIDEWHARVRVDTFMPVLKLSGKDYTLDLQSNPNMYMSVGGNENRSWCSDKSNGTTSNAPGIFMSSSNISSNPFKDIPIINEWFADVHGPIYAYFTSNSESNTLGDLRIDVASDIININKVIDDFERFITSTLNKQELKLTNFTKTKYIQLRTVLNETKSFIGTNWYSFFKGHTSDLVHLLPELWSKLKELEETERSLYVLNEASSNMSTLVKMDIDIMRHNIDNAINKLTQQVVMKAGSYSAYGLKLSPRLRVFGLDLGTYDAEIVLSADAVDTCNRMKDVYKLLNGESVIRFIGILRENTMFGRFIRADKGANIGGAVGNVIKNTMVQIKSTINMLGFKTTEDLFISDNQIYSFIEGNVWGKFPVHVNISSMVNTDWYDSTFHLRGRFIAKRQVASQILDTGLYFQDSYLDALEKASEMVILESQTRLHKAKETISNAQIDLRKAQNVLDEKTKKVQEANVELDKAVVILESAKGKLQTVIGPFESKVNELSEAEGKLEKICKIKDCDNVCVPGIHCSICHKAVSGIKLPYICCNKTNCLISVPNTHCIAPNMMCVGIRATALAATETFRTMSMHDLKIAKGDVSKAELEVEKSVVITNIAQGALNLAKLELKRAQNVLNGSLETYEAVRYTVRGATEMKRLIDTFKLNNMHGVKNCVFNIELKKVDSPVFDVSCQVNAYNQGWKTVQMRIDFKNSKETIWRAAKASIDVFVELFKNMIQTRNIRDITFKASNNINTLEQVLNKTEFNAFYSTDTSTLHAINVINNTLGMNSSISTDYDCRVKLYQDKCSNISRVQTFLINIFDTLAHIANISKKNLDEVSNTSRVVQDHDLNLIMQDMFFEDVAVDTVYATTVYNLTQFDLNQTLLDIKSSMAANPFVQGLKSVKQFSSAAIEAELAAAESAALLDHWTLAMKNCTIELQSFEQHECTGFKDCVMYSISTLYDLYDDTLNTTDITRIRALIIELESDIINVFGNTSQTVTSLYQLSESIGSKLQRIVESNIFCSEPPTFVTKLRNKKTILGSSIMFKCHIKSNPESTYWWFKNGKYLPRKSSAVMTIEDVTNIDVAAYTCTAGNIVANVTSPKAFLSIVQAKDLCKDNDDAVAIDDGHCRTYLKCNQTGTSKLFCCQPGYMFDPEALSCVSTDDLECKQETCLRNHIEGCREDILATFDNPVQQKTLKNHGNGNLTIFGELSQILSSQGISYGIFGGSSGVDIWRYANVSFPSVTMTITFKHTPSVNDNRQVLVSNCRGATDTSSPSFEVSLDPRQSLVKFYGTTRFESVGIYIPFYVGTWNQFKLYFDGKHALMLNENIEDNTKNDTRVNPFQGEITAGLGALKLGPCLGKRNENGFTGFISEFSFSPCIGKDGKELIEKYVKQ